jgi:hypothetical protein
MFDSLVDCGLYEWPDKPHIIRITSMNDTAINRVELDISNFDDTDGAYFKSVPYVENQWEWNPKEQVGIFHFNIKYEIDNKQKTFRVPIHILPRKIDHQVFDCIMNDLRRRHISIYKRHAPEIWDAKNKSLELSSFEEQFQKLKTNFGQLETVVRRITDNPHKKIIKEYQLVDFHQLAELDANIISHIASLRGGTIRPNNHGIASQLQNIMRGHLPNKVCRPYTVINYDTPENRLVKKYLELLRISIFTLKNLKLTGCENTDDLAICEKYARRITTLERLPFLEDVSPATSIVSDSIVFQKDCNYRTFYELGQEILMSPFFNKSKIFRMPIKNLNLLYELWCVVAIYDGLCERIKEDWKIYDSDVFKKTRSGFLIDLDERTKNNRIFTATKNDTSIEMWYQKEYSAYYKKRIPDITFEIRINGILDQMIIIDPKYRQVLDYGEDDPEGALPKMHLYKDAMVFEGKRPVKEAYVLYPGDNNIDDLYSQNKIFKAFDHNDDVIGALAFRPDTLSKQVERQLDFIYERVFSQRLIQQP